MKLTHKILKLIIENKDKEFTIREISRQLRTDYKNTYDAVQKIKDSVKINKKGNASYVSFSRMLTNQIYEVEQIRRNKIKKHIQLIYEDIYSLDNPFFIAVLFGSYAKNKHTRNSDVDICIIHDNEKEITQIASRLSIHPKIELHIFHYSEFLQLIKSKEFNVGNEIVKNGIILKNIEAYYEVIKHG